MARALRGKLAATAILLSLASVAHAGKTFITAALVPPSGGSLTCLVVNGGEDTIEVDLQIYTLGGGLLLNLIGSPVAAHGTTFGMVGAGAARYCVVKVVSGSSKAVRVSLTANASGGTAVAAIEGR